MNIFYLDNDPEYAAKYHCDKHVVKMLTEYTQMLMAAYYDESSMIDSRCLAFGKVYRLTHKNHPSTKWARSSIRNWKFLLNLAKQLAKEYTRRYKRTHACEAMLNDMENVPPLIQDVGWWEPPQCMPKECTDVDTVQAYRNYYCLHKSKFAKWKTGEIPYWYNTGA